MVALFLYLKGMTGALAPLSYLVVNTRLDRKNLEGTNTLASETIKVWLPIIFIKLFLQ